jgi:hypothetical protein
MANASRKDSEKLLETAKEIKKVIETLHKDICHIQARIKLPLLIMDHFDHHSRKWTSLKQDVQDLAKEVHAQFFILTGESNGLIPKLNSFRKTETVAIESTPPVKTRSYTQRRVYGGRDRRTWRKRKRNTGKSKSKDAATKNESNWDSIFCDSDKAVILYDAVKELGNPECIGSHYSITWTDIAKCGFSNKEDFKRNGIKTLADLERFIRNK